MAQTNFNEKFQRFTRVIEHAVGSPWAFLIATLSVVVWGVLGPFYGFSDTWQLICNTFSTIVTYLLLFLVQSTQTRDTAAINLKLDQLILVAREASNTLVDIESKSAEEISAEKEAITRLAEKD